MDAVAVMLNVRGWRCVVVGGGSVAVRRATALAEAGAKVVVIAPAPDPQLREVPGVAVYERRFVPGDATDARLVIVATDDPAVNAAAAAAARAAGALVNRADEPGEGDAQFAATRRVGPMTLAVHSGGASAAAAGAIADELVAKLDPDWAVLLDVAGRYREVVQHRIPAGEARQRRLRKLADSTAIRILKEQGRAALEAYCQRLADPDAGPPP